ncbi:hypothetical protein Tco_0164040 [Tanacetum coccineum]
MLDYKELTLNLDDFRTIFHLPQAIENNHDHFVLALTFSRMVPFYINNLGFTLELRSTSNFKTTGLLQPWQTLCKMFSRCLTTYVTFYDQPSVKIMQMIYCFVKNIHVDYIELLWEGFYYSLKNPTTMIPYPRFTKLIVSLYMTTFLEILRRARDRYHNLADDVMIKSIFNSGKSKETNPQPSSFTPSSSSPKSKLSAKNRLLSLFKAKPGCFRRYKSFFQELQGRYGYLFEHLLAKFMPRRNFNEIAKNLEDIMMESLPKLSQADVAKMIVEAIQRERKNLRSEVSSQVNVAITNHIPLQVATTSCRPSTVRPKDQDDPRDDAHPEGENSAKRQKISKTKLRKVVDEMLRQQCTLGDEHQYHIDQMQNFLKDDYGSLSVFIRSTMIWERVYDFQLGVESYQKQVNLTAPTITFPVMEGLKSYNNDVKYGYVTHNRSKEDVEYLQLFADEIEERLKYCDQMRRWKMYVNGRPLGPRRERP